MPLVRFAIKTIGGLGGVNTPLCHGSTLARLYGRRLGGGTARRYGDRPSLLSGGRASHRSHSKCPVYWGVARGCVNYHPGNIS